MPNRITIPIIGIFGALGVGLGAFGAHALKAQLTANGHLETWQTAVHYQLIHTVAALALTLSLNVPKETAQAKFFRAAVSSWLVGIILFSGSLFIISLDGPRWLWPATPAGGFAFLTGWCLLLAGGLKSPRAEK